MRSDPHKTLLYRKVNTRARGVCHKFGGDHRHERNTKRETLARVSEVKTGSMHGGTKRGLDYTPLFRFLLSKVGEPWESVRTQAVPRLDKENPIYWIVARNEHEKQPVVRVGNNSYFSGLYVDGDGLLAKVAPDLRNEDLKPQCKCCTHSFNGEPLIAKFEEKP